MTRFHTTRLMMTTALAALALPLAAGAALGQTAGFAVEVAPSFDGYTPVRVGVRVFGPVAEPASSFVRGCQGAVLPEAAGAAFDVAEGMNTLAFTGAGEGLTGLVLGTPDGLYRCALADDRGYVSTVVANAAGGRYTAWLAGPEGSVLDARLIASDTPVSAVELFGFDVARLGEPRNGRFVYSAVAGGERQTLLENGRLFTDTEIRALDMQNCWGYARLDAADAVLTLDQATDRFSIFATSDRDLVMAVVTPSGQVLCNDDAFELYPAVTIDGAEAGDYQVFVGGYSQGGEAYYTLYTSAGGPAFSNAQVDLNAPPTYGYVGFDINAAGQGQLLLNANVMADTPVEMLSSEIFCPGFVDVSAPTMVLSVDASQPMISIYARSSSDLTLTVRGPDGIWNCNDDAFELNPGVSLTNVQPGDYQVWVGAYNQGDTGNYNLYASMGSPNWQGADAGSGTGTGGVMRSDLLNATAEPAVGRVTYGPQTVSDPRIIFDILPSQTEAFGIVAGCAGFITPERPDVVIDVEAGLPQLMIYAVSEGDAALVVQGPDGNILCNDDFEGLNPGVMMQSPMPGAYAVFAGSYTGNGGLATLGVTIASPQWVMDREH